MTPLGIENSSARVLPAGTVCLSRTASVGYVVVMGVDMATSQDFVNWVCGPSLDPRYLKFALQCDQDALRRFAVGTTHQTIYFPEVKAFHVLLPPIEEQRGIAATLGALDDKIESNRRELEGIAALSQSVFAHWKASLGPARQVSFGEFADVLGGATPRTSEPRFWNGQIPWLTPTDVTRLAAPYLTFTSRSITVEGLESCTASLHPVGTILMTSRATIGSFAINQVPTATNQGFIAVRPRRHFDRWYLFEEMQARVQEFIARANGSTFLEISRGSFKVLPLDVPADIDLMQLDRQLDPLHRLGAHLAGESRRLAALRDALLPELLAGRIRVPEAQEQIDDRTDVTKGET